MGPEMADIAVTELEPLRFRVEVADGSGGTTHTVRVPDELLRDLGVDRDAAGNLVRESFAFLLEREPASQILREFSLEVIGRYFPEYRTEMARRFAD